MIGTESNEAFLQPPQLDRCLEIQLDTLSLASWAELQERYMSGQLTCEVMTELDQLLTLCLNWAR